MSSLVMSTFPAEKVLKDEEKQKLKNPTVNLGVESLTNEERVAGRNGPRLQRSCCWSAWRAIVDGCVL